MKRRAAADESACIRQNAAGAPRAARSSGTRMDVTALQRPASAGGARRALASLAALSGQLFPAAQEAAQASRAAALGATIRDTLATRILWRQASARRLCSKT